MSGHCFVTHGAVNARELPRQLPAASSDTLIRRARRWYWRVTWKPGRKALEGTKRTFYHGRYVDSSDCVISFARANSLAWWIAALHNAAHRHRPYPLDWRLCRLADWVAGSVCLERLDRYR